MLLNVNSENKVVQNEPAEFYRRPAATVLFLQGWHLVHFPKTSNSETDLQLMDTGGLSLIRMELI